MGRGAKQVGRGIDPHSPERAGRNRPITWDLCTWDFCTWDFCTWDFCTWDLSRCRREQLAWALAAITDNRSDNL